MQRYKVHIVWGIVVIIAFAGGMLYGRSGATTSAANRGTASSATRSGTFSRTGGGGTIGQIISVDSSSMSVSLPGGNSEVVFYSSSTPIMKSTVTPVSASSLSAGTRVMVSGTSNSDGSLTAQSIQVVTGSGFSGGGGASGTRPSGPSNGQ